MWLRSYPRLLQLSTLLLDEIVYTDCRAHCAWFGRINLSNMELTMMNIAVTLILVKLGLDSVKLRSNSPGKSAFVVG
jgi:hypothetical protein